MILRYYKAKGLRIRDGLWRHKPWEEINIEYMLQIILKLKNNKEKHNTKNWLSKYCSYDINKKRRNFNQQMDSTA
jgi:hypothetical protein